ncbi:MAG: AAA family ATPase [Agarilytica sp.]
MSTSLEHEQTYFYTPALKSLVQQISHLAFFGDGISLVLGEKGSGKSSLAKELCTQFEPAHQHVSLCFSSEVELADCLEQVASGLGVRAEEGAVSAGELLGELRHYVQALVQDKKLVILTIDNAHFLDDQALGALISLLQGANSPNSGLHYVFFSEPGLDRRVDALQIIDVAAYDFLLPNFSPTELSSFLETFPHLQETLNSSLVQKLWSGSKGVPGKALSILGEGDTPGRTTPKPSGGDTENLKTSLFSSLPFGHITAIVVLIAVLLSTLLLRGGGDDYKVQPIQSGSLAVNAGDQQADKLSEKEQEGISRDDAITAGQDQVQPEEGVSELQSEEPGHESESLEEESVVEFAEQASISARDTIDPAQKDTFSGEITASTPPQERLNTPLPEAKPDSKKLDSKSKREDSESLDSHEEVLEFGEAEDRVVTLPTLSAGKALTEPEIFLLAQNPEFYTLQVIAASKKASLDAYVKRQANRASLYMYRGVREGKSWYVVVQGVYSSRKAALNARRLLPSEQAKAGPWPRQLSSIQEEIEEFRNN